MHATYLDFDLEIGIGQGREYPVVVRSPAGETRAIMTFPFDELALENRLLKLQNVLLRSEGKRRLAPSQDELAVREFGKNLFDAALVEDVRSLFYESRRMASQQDAGLRIRLRVASPSLAALPWEFLYDTRHGHICLSVNTPVVRYVELPQPPQPLTVTLPLRILGMIVSPVDLQDLDLKREQTRLERAIEPLSAKGLVEVTWLEGQTWRDLQRAMRRGPWHIFHFAGHGGFDANADEGIVMLADDDGRARPFRATELGRLLADHRPMRLVMLNACEGGRNSERDIFSSTASILVRAGLPAVVAMQYEITDQAAIELTKAFYEALADELPVDAALAEARKAVSLAVSNSFEWGTPVLYMRAVDGVLFKSYEAHSHRVEAQDQKTSQIGPAPSIGELELPLGAETSPPMLSATPGRLLDRSPDLFCPNCGIRVNSSAKRCPSCGTQITTYEVGGQTFLFVALLRSRYGLTDVVGRGGSKTVYRALDLHTSSVCAVLQLEEMGGEAQNVEFMRQWGTLDHPGLVALRDSFIEQGKRYLVTDFVEGSTLEDLLTDAGTALPEAQVARWGILICDILAYLHSRTPPIIVRDVKPSNFIVSPDHKRVVLIDLEISRAYKSGKLRDTTAMGTLGYAAPEQYGKAQTDERSDIYGLGVTLYRLLTSHQPDYPHDLPPVRQLNPKLNAKWEPLLLRATQIDREKRYRSALQMKTDLVSLVSAL